MTAELVQVSFDKIMQTRTYTVVILGTEEKRFAIYTEPGIGKIMQLSLSNSVKPRPYTHDLINLILQGTDAKITRVIINDIQDTIYFARLILEYKKDGLRQIIEIDGRPSDCITLALMNDVPVYCTKEVLENALSIED